jgi:lysophospholipase L1-like esterase
MIKIWAIRLSVAFNVLVIAAALSLWLNPSTLLAGFLQGMYDRKVSFFEVFPVERGDTVFLGDSITEGGQWSEMFPTLPVKNRGIGGDTTTGVIARLQQITGASPAALFIKIGTNDLTHGPDDVATSYLQYEAIVTTVQRESPDTRIYLQSILPRGADYRERVEAFNREIKRMATALNATYIDLYPHFLEADGSIADAYSNDELHLNGQGYALWQSLLQPYVAP